MATNKQAARRIERDERAKARAEIAATAAALKKARADLKDHQRQTVAKRRAIAKQLAQDVKALRAKLRKVPREVLDKLRAARDSYRAWWASVLVERQRRRDEIASLRESLAELRKATPELIREAVFKRSELAAWERYDLDMKSEATGAAMARETRKAGRIAQGTRAGHRRGSGLLAKRPTVSRAEAGRLQRDRRVEFESIVEANLEPEAAAWYRGHKREFPGHSSGLPPDRVAELVVESLAEQPEEAMSSLQDRADVKVVEELRKMGYL
jgi:hypothetical protein